MAIIANTYKTYEAKGQRESLADVIYNISPEEVPFMSNAGRDEADAVFNEWQMDSLGATDTNNAQLEGDDITAFDAVVPTIRVGNYQQISRKTVLVSGTEEKVRKAGRKSELSYQVAKKGAELKRDQETILLSNQAAVAGSAAVARKTGSLLAFIFTNTDKGAAGVDPVYTTFPNNARTDGTQRPFTEAILKTVAQKVWTAGGKLDTLLVNASQKVAASAFAGIATKTYDMTEAVTAAIIGAADVYVGDFGTLTIVPDRFMRTRDALFIDWEYVRVNYLRQFFVEKLAKTGDAEKRMLLAEYGLQVKNEAALGIAADLT